MEFKLAHDTIIPSNVQNGVCVISKNKKYIVKFYDENIIFQIHEKDSRNDVDEIAYIESTLKENEWYYIGNECCSNILQEPKKVDLTYIFFSDATHVARCYCYDLKKTLGKRNVILKLVKQWQYALNHSNMVVNSLLHYQIENQFVGVITENNDRATLLSEINKLKPLNELKNPKLPEFLVSKNKTQNIQNNEELKILVDFYNGKALLNNKYYKIDIRVFQLAENPTYTMHFDSGILS